LSEGRVCKDDLERQHVRGRDAEFASTLEAVDEQAAETTSSIANAASIVTMIPEAAAAGA
jgi:hypothetical protein